MGCYQPIFLTLDMKKTDFALEEYENCKLSKKGGDQMKFEKYADLTNVIPLQCRDNLCFYLERKVSEYYAIVLEKEDPLRIRKTMERIEKKVWCVKTPENCSSKVPKLETNV